MQWVRLGAVPWASQFFSPRFFSADLAPEAALRHHPGPRGLSYLPDPEQPVQGPLLTLMNRDSN